MVFKIPFHAKLGMMAEQKHSPRSANVLLRCKTNGGREQSGLQRSRWTVLLSAVVLAHLGKRTESHRFTPPENLA